MQLKDFLGMSLLSVLSLSANTYAQTISAWCYSRFQATEGRIEVCPSGEPGLVVIHSRRPQNCLAAALPDNDSEGNKWRAGDYMRLTFRYLPAKGHFALSRYDYRDAMLLPDWRSWDYGHSINLASVASAYLGDLKMAILPTGSRIKWIERIEVLSKCVTLLIWEPNNATSLNLWLITSDGGAISVVEKLPILDNESFEGVEIMDCLGQGHRDLILYTESHGAHCTFPEAYLIRFGDSKDRPKYFFDYNDSPTDWLTKTKLENQHFPLLPIN